MVRTGCQTDERRLIGTLRCDSDVSAMDKIVTERSEHDNTAWLGSLKNIPGLVTTFDSAAIRQYVLMTAL